jgi:hypothetical protein
MSFNLRRDAAPQATPLSMYIHRFGSEVSISGERGASNLPVESGFFQHSELNSAPYTYESK